MVTGSKVITGNRDVDFVSVAPFEVNDEKIISDENVVNAITCDFPCKIFKKNHTAWFMVQWSEISYSVSVW